MSDKAMEANDTVEEEVVDGGVDDKAVEDAAEDATAKAGDAPDEKVEAGGKSEADAEAVNPWSMFRDGLEDGDMKELAKRFNSGEDVLKSVADLRKEMSARIKVPGKNASEEDVARFRKAIGVPESPDEYEAPVPDGYEMTEVDESMLDTFRGIAHEAGVPKKAADAFFGKALELNAEAARQVAKLTTEAQEKAVADLKKEWGSDYDAKVNLALRAVDSFGGGKLRDMFENVRVEGGGRLGDVPELIRAFANIGARSGEDGVLSPANSDEMRTIDDEINAILEDAPIGSEKYATRAVQEKLRVLYARKSGDRPIVGSPERTR